MVERVLVTVLLLTFTSFTVFIVKKPSSESCVSHMTQSCLSHLPSHLWESHLQSHLTLKMAAAQGVDTSVANNSPSQDSSHPDDHFQPTYVTPGFKQFSRLTVL